MTTIREAISLAIKNERISISEFAKSVGLDRTGIQRFCNGERGMSIAAIETMVQALGLELVKTLRCDENTE